MAKKRAAKKRRRVVNNRVKRYAVRVGVVLPHGYKLVKRKGKKSRKKKK